MFALAHFSDPHLAEWRVGAPHRLLGKRLIGLLSWRCKRQAIHRRTVLDLLVADLKAQTPDHIALTGDIVNISLPDEFAQATRWLATLAAPDRLSVVPGNHDAYVPTDWAATLGQWTPYMSGDGAHVAGPESFPYLRRRGDLALIGLSTAAPMSWRSAGGIIGAAQLEKLAQLLRQTGAERLCRVILIHHPPQEGSGPSRKALIDAPAFREIVADCGTELILHGHTHRSMMARLPTSQGAALVLGVPSASALPHHGKDHARYQLIGIERLPGEAGWRFAVELRGLAPDRQSIRTESHFEARSGAF